MATGEEHPEWERTLLENGLHCPICVDFLFEPIRLSCGHAFCLPCLVQSTRLAPDGQRCPECRALIEIRDLFTHPVDEALQAQVQTLVPSERLSTRAAECLDQLESLRRHDKRRVPCIVMPGTDLENRRAVRLQLYARFTTLIPRADENGKLFLCMPARPEEGMDGLLVQLKGVHYRRDGGASIEGIGKERVTVRRTWFDSACGLHYADIDGPFSSTTERPRVGSFSEPSRSLQAFASASTKQCLQAAIFEGSRAYYRGGHLLCAQIYRDAAAAQLREAGVNDHVLRCLRRAVRDADAEYSRERINVASRILRRTFDDILAMPVGSAEEDDARLPLSPGSVELPVLYLEAGYHSCGGSGCVRFEGSDYCGLARTVLQTPDKLLLFSGRGVPTTGSRVTCAKLEECKFEASCVVTITFRGLHTACVSHVREESGVMYASFEKAQDNCCSLQ